MRLPITTLCYIEKDDCYLMLHRVKKENDVNKDKWIGVGGHFELNESPEECLLREVKEETGLTLTDYRLVGIVTFVCETEMEYMFLYNATGFTGNLIECTEGNLEWIKKQDFIKLPHWEGDLIFLDLMERKVPTFSLKLVYNKGELVKKILNGTEL